MKVFILFLFTTFLAACSSTGNSNRIAKSNYEVIYSDSTFTIEQGYKLLDDGWFTPKYRIKGKLRNMSRYPLVAQYNCGKNLDAFDHVMMVTESGSSEYIYETEEVLSNWLGTKKRSTSNINGLNCQKRPIKVWFANKSQYPRGSEEIGHSFGGNVSDGNLNTYDVVGNTKLIGFYNIHSKNFTKHLKINNLDWGVQAQLFYINPDIYDRSIYNPERFESRDYREWHTNITRDKFYVTGVLTSHDNYKHLSFYPTDRIPWLTHDFTFSRDKIDKEAHTLTMDYYAGNYKLRNHFYRQFFAGETFQSVKNKFRRIAEFKRLEFFATQDCLIDKYGDYAKWTQLPNETECKDSNTLYSHFVAESAPIGLADETGQTLLMSAALEGNLNLVSTLLLKGADINATDFRGNTVMHYAFSSPDESINNARLKLIEFLIDKGALYSQLNKDNLTPEQKYIANRNKYFNEKKRDGEFDQQWQEMLEQKRQGAIARKIQNDRVRQELEESEKVDIGEAIGVGIKTLATGMAQENRRLEREKQEQFLRQARRYGSQSSQPEESFSSDDNNSNQNSAVYVAYYWCAWGVPASAGNDSKRNVFQFYSNVISGSSVESLRARASSVKGLVYSQFVRTTGGSKSSLECSADTSSWKSGGITVSKAIQEKTKYKDLEVKKAKDRANEFNRRTHSGTRKEVIQFSI